MRQFRPGFSLVELVVVIVILGLLASMAIPRLSRGAAGADGAALRSNLAMLRSAIQRYAAEHAGAFPGYHTSDGSLDGDGDEADFFAQLLRCTSATGAAGACDATRVFGPYLVQMPPMTIGGLSPEEATDVAFEEDAPLIAEDDPDEGWMYNPATGEIIANTTLPDDAGVAYSDY